MIFFANLKLLNGTTYLMYFVMTLSAQQLKKTETRRNSKNMYNSALL